MFNTGGLTKGLSFIKIINGLSKTLQVANQIIPLYQKAKPAITNARNMLGVLKEINKTTPNDQNNKVKRISPEKASPTKKTGTSPTFFL